MLTVIDGKPAIKVDKVGIGEKTLSKAPVLKFAHRFISLSGGDISGEWIVRNLSGFGFPAKSLALIGIKNIDPDYARRGGVRPIGVTPGTHDIPPKAAEIRGDVEAPHYITTVCPLDENAQLETYAEDVNAINFFLFGYFTLDY